MVTCVVEKVMDYNAYELKAGDKKVELVFEFYGINRLKKGDKILIHQSLLDKNSKNFSQPHAFELCNQLDAKAIKESNHEEFVVARAGNKNYVLRRIYG